MYGPGGLPLEQITSSGTLYYHQDQLGSTRALSNSAGTVVRTYTYDAYGRLTGSTGTVSNPVGFGGQYTDAETGFIYLRARYYDPSMAQMLTRDPAEALTQEPYDYVANNPLNGTDPTGLWNYHFDYDLGASSMTPEQLMTVVAANFGPLFTVTGHRATLYPGEVMHLHWGPIPGWVRVVHMTATGWTFDTSLHVDWPGFVRFSFSQSDDCHLHLEIHANVNGAGWGLEIPGLHQLYMHKVKELWGQFASNLRKEVLSNE
jgi:RHS repeat-associated protein